MAKSTRNKWIYYIIKLGIDADLNQVAMHVGADPDISCGGYSIRFHAGIPTVYRGDPYENDSKYVGRISDGSGEMYDFYIRCVLNEDVRRFTRVDVFPNTKFLLVCMYDETPGTEDIKDMIKVLLGTGAVDKFYNKGTYLTEDARKDENQRLLPK
jgi:hypothetical protein